MKDRLPPSKRIGVTLGRLGINCLSPIRFRRLEAAAIDALVNELRAEHESARRAIKRLERKAKDRQRLVVSGEHTS